MTRDRRFRALLTSFGRLPRELEWVRLLELDDKRRRLEPVPCKKKKTATTGPTRPTWTNAVPVLGNHKFNKACLVFVLANVIPAGSWKSSVGVSFLSTLWQSTGRPCFLSGAHAKERQERERGQLDTLKKYYRMEPHAQKQHCIWHQCKR